MKEYLFYDEISGEEFLVETDMKEKAYLCAYAYFEEPKFVREVSHWEAEMMGLDTYQKGENKMEYYGIYANKKKNYLLDVADNYDDGLSLFLDWWFDGYDDCILTKITEEEYKTVAED